MNVVLICIAGLVLIIFCYSLVEKLKVISDKKEIEKIEKAAEQKRLEEERAKTKAREQAEWENILKEREQKFGSLTTSMAIGYDRKNYIYVYEESKVIFIKGRELTFKDILSCTVEKNLCRKGVTTYTTTPDKGEMAMEELLWGMGKKYNVKTTTHVEKTPDVYNYIVYIGVNSISDPQIELKTSFLDIANKVKSLMDVIINANKNA